MKYYEEVTGFTEDGLIGGEHHAAVIHNVSLAGGAAVERGALICADEQGKYSPVSAAADASKPMAIAASTCTADSIGAVTQGYVSGVFNAGKVKVASGLDVETFRQGLRTQGIWLTKEVSS